MKSSVNMVFKDSCFMTSTQDYCHIVYVKPLILRRHYFPFIKSYTIHTTRILNQLVRNWESQAWCTVPYIHQKKRQIAEYRLKTRHLTWIHCKFILFSTFQSTGSNHQLLSILEPPPLNYSYRNIYCKRNSHLHFLYSS